jgi:hypothetical protein
MMHSINTIRSAARAILALAVVALLVWKFEAWAPLRLPVSARTNQTERGDYKGDLGFLRRHWAPPQSPGESNHYIDLWSPGDLASFARANGLTNNHALFIDSHSKGGCSFRSSGFGIYPRATLVEPGSRAPYYSVRDLATVIGPENAATIHNVLLAGCNRDGRFRSAEIRQHFVNATNITYMEPGELAFKPMFHQALVLPSDEIKPLYGEPRRVSATRVECDIVNEPRRGTRQLGAYVADLYLPGARKPFLTRKAGRELLAPERVTSVATRTIADGTLDEP